MQKRSKEAWLREGLTVLAQVGPQSLTIDIICQRMGVTKGSFYHHFKNRQDYIKGILKLWEEENTSRLIETAETQSDIESKLDALVKLVYEIPRYHEMAVRAFALYDPVAHKYQESIDSKRQAYLLKLNQLFFKDREKAQLLATLDYAWFLGIISVIPEISKTKLQKIINIYKEMKRSYLKANSGGVQ
jgi:AcrR family transcriptional regulator